MDIKDIPKIKKITRTCVLCGGQFIVRLFPDGSYNGGNYFTTVGKTKTPKDEPEYWEYDACYNDR